jgi:hypothetical protein
MVTARLSSRAFAPPGGGRSGRRHGFLEVDFMVALAILALAVLPVGYSVVQERRLAQAYYVRAIAMEIVDGELEVLRAGAGREFKDGAHAYEPRAESAAQLPPGTFTLTVTGGQLQLAWRPEGRGAGSAIVREGPVRP